HHQEDLAQALSLDWRDTDTKFQEPDWPGDPKRATVRRIAEMLGSIPAGDGAVENWLRHLTFHVAIGNNDAHAKNVALMHLSTGTELAQVYDASPNLFQAGLVKWDLSLAVNGIFDHRKLSVESILEEANSWGVIAADRASALVSATLVALDGAITDIMPPHGVSDDMIEHLEWNVRRLLAGEVIGELKS
ncbi:MAG TPA: HipA domain-containing protein, partial [Acidimicrobiales bacterium]|nr:HipA domain-containing protein [Acidimicrobiales bacterium]